MIEWMVFCEDQFHEKFVGQLIRRVAQESRLAVNLKFRTARGGLPRMQREFREFLRDLTVDCSSAPQGLVVVADANCKGYQERRKDLLSALDQFGKFRDRTAFAIPDPHIERWMMVDPHAFKIVFDEGCDPLPKIKCRKDEYKRLLLQQIRKCQIDTSLGGMEFAEDIVDAMDLQKSGDAERSMGRFLAELRGIMKNTRSIAPR